MRRGRRPKEYDLPAADRWFRAVVHRGAACVVCMSKRDLQAHHVLSKTFLEQVARGLGMDNAARNDLLWDSRNGIALCTRCHERHTNRYRAVPRYLLGRRAWDFVRYVDNLLETEAASVRIEAEYPSA